jgi:hypothetical protein
MLVSKNCSNSTYCNSIVSTYLGKTVHNARNNMNWTAKKETGRLRVSEKVFDTTFT